MSLFDDEFAALIAEVDETIPVIDSAVVAFKGVPALIQAGIDAAIAKGATPAQLAQLSESKTKLEAKATELAEAVVSHLGTQPSTPDPNAPPTEMPSTRMRKPQQ